MRTRDTRAEASVTWSRVDVRFEEAEPHILERRIDDVFGEFTGAREALLRGAKAL